MQTDQIVIIRINGYDYDVLEEPAPAAPVQITDGPEWAEAVMGAACPRCLANRWRVCRTPSGEVLGRSHAVRVERARRQGRIV